MAIHNTKSRKEIMEFLTATATANSESDVQAKLLKIFDPVKSRYEMGDVFEDVLGYNPINHYDREDIKELLHMAIEGMETDHPQEAKAIDTHSSIIVDRALDAYDGDRMDTLRLLVAREAQQYVDAMSVYSYFGVTDPDGFETDSDDDEEVDPIGDYEGDASIDAEDDLNNPPDLLGRDEDEQFQYGEDDISEEEDD